MEKNSLTYLLSSFAVKHRDNLEKLMSEIDLHCGQVFVLHSLWEADGQSQAELVKNLKVSAPTVYNLVKKLSDKGFVDLQKDSLDLRISRVYLTVKGLQIKGAVEEQWRKLEELTFKNLTEPEKMMASLLFQKMSDNSGEK